MKIYLFISIAVAATLTNNAFITTLLTTNNNPIILTGSSLQKELALYNQTAFRAFNLEITPTNLDRMTNHPINETKVPCKLFIDYNTPQVQTFADFVVCGYKGNVGSLLFCFDEYAHNNGECRKLSLSVENLVVKKSSLFERLLFNGIPVDFSMISERTAFYLMQSFHMIAPMSTHAKLFVNGMYWGLYSFVESVDGHFTKLRFGDDKSEGKGGLFKDLWLNPLHIANIKKTFKAGSSKKSDMKFIQKVMTDIVKTPFEGNKPLLLFEKYFDIASLINMTAFNTIIGNTDDWRQRHNFFLYVKTDSKKQKKIVFIPWDYDRLYDKGNANRGALQGRPWWDIGATANFFACNQTISSSEQKARSIVGGNDIAKINWYKNMFDQLPPDIDIPVTCDKFTQLMAFALKKRILSRARYFANHVNLTSLQKQWTTWNNQIMTALVYDKDGPPVSTVLSEQKLLYQHLSKTISVVLK